MGPPWGTHGGMGPHGAPMGLPWAPHGPWGPLGPHGTPMGTQGALEALFTGDFPIAMGAPTSTPYLHPMSGFWGGYPKGSATEQATRPFPPFPPIPPPLVPPCSPFVALFTGDFPIALRGLLRGAREGSLLE